MGLLKISTRDARVARVRKPYRAYVDNELGGLRFESTIKQDPIIVSVGNVWARIMSLALHGAEDDMWAFYDSLMRGVKPQTDYLS